MGHAELMSVSYLCFCEAAMVRRAVGRAGFFAVFFFSAS